MQCQQPALGKKPTNKEEKKENAARKHKPTHIQDWISSSSDDEDEKGEACIFCNALHQDKKGGKGWIQCEGCQGWAHETCCKAEEEDDTFFG